MTFQVVDHTTSSYVQGLLCCSQVAGETLVFCLLPIVCDSSSPDVLHAFSESIFILQGGFLKDYSISVSRYCNPKIAKTALTRFVKC